MQKFNWTSIKAFDMQAAQLKTKQKLPEQQQTANS